MQQKLILVTGGLGLLGTAVVKSLLLHGNYKVRVVDMITETNRNHPFLHEQNDNLEVCDIDLRDEVAARDMMQNVHTCVHLAAIAGGIASFHRSPSTLLRNNIGVLTTVFDAAIAHKIQHIIYISSSMVYENALSFPLTEDTTNALPAPLSAYGFSKLAGEYYCRTAWQEFALPYTILRPFNVYGPGEYPASEPGIAHVIPDLIKKMRSEELPIRLFGNGQQTRCYTHINDVTRAIAIAVEHPNAINQDFIISSEREISVLALAQLLWTMLGNDAQAFAWQEEPSFAVDVQRRWPSTQKAKSLLGWQAEVPLEEGLHALIQWFADNQMSLRSE